MVLVDNDQFLSDLTRLFNTQKSKSSGSVFITMKRHVDSTGKSKRGVKAETDGESHCLMRATNGKRKVSTVIGAKDVTRFQMSYANLLKANMDALKKKEKAKAKAKVAAKGKPSTPVGTAAASTAPASTKSAKAKKAKADQPTPMEH